MDWKALEERISGLKGKIGFYYKNMVTGECYKYQADEAFGAASLVKLPILMHVVKMIENGELSGSEKLLVTDADKKPSCGALLSISGDIEVDIDSLCRLMITISDNTATNMLIHRVGVQKLSEGFRNMGLHKTVIQRAFFDDEAAAKGLENKVCPEETGMLLEQIYRREFVSPEASEKIENILLLQQIRHKIPGYIGRKKKIANKTGEDGNTTHDAAIVFAGEPFVLVVNANDTDVPETERFIRETALMLYKENHGE